MCSKVGSVYHKVLLLVFFFEGVGWGGGAGDEFSFPV